MLLFTLLITLTISDQLIYVQQTFRHGARTPIYPSPLDNTLNYINQKGQLTNQGKKMHYLLGKQIYKKYWIDLGFGNDINGSKIYVKSTNINRTIQSAQSHLIGLFQNISPPQITQDLIQFTYPAWSDRISFNSTTGPVYIDQQVQNFKSFPIHTQKSGSNMLNPGDFLYQFSYDNCPNQQQWQQQNQNSGFTHNFINNPNISSAIEQLKNQLGIDSITLNQVGQLVDNYYCLLYLSQQTLSIYQKHRTEYDLIHNINLYINTAFTQKQKQVVTTPYFAATIKNMDNIINNQQSEKFIIYSAHDLTLLTVLAALQLANAQCIYDLYLKNSKTSDQCVYDFPAFASSLIFQLWKSQTTQYVKIIYLGSPLKIPFCDYSQNCSYTKFREFLNNSMKVNYLSDCGVKGLPIRQSNSNKTGLLVGIGITGALLLGIIVYEIIRFYKKKSKGQAIEPKNFSQQKQQQI